MVCGIEIGYIFQLGSKYIDVFIVDVFGEDGKFVWLIMGFYGIGVFWLVVVVVEQYYDELGFCWLLMVVLFDVYLVIVNKDVQVCVGVIVLVVDLDWLGVEVLLDDCQVLFGVKFKDVELLGMFWIVVVGCGWVDGVVELCDWFSGQICELVVGVLLVIDIVVVVIGQLFVFVWKGCGDGLGVQYFVLVGGYYCVFGQSC